MKLRRPPRLPRRAESGTPLVHARQVSVRRGDRLVIRDADLQIRAGELVALIGPNGAGKSTLLAALAGDLAPSTGEVVLDGEPLLSWSASELAMRRSVLPQDVTVSFPFLVRDVVRMGRAPWARTPASEQDDAIVARTLRATDTAHLALRTFPTLSGGERARVALARVWAQRAQLMLLDEPTASLDVRHQELVLAIARAGTRRGDGVAIVVHDLALAARHADRVVLVHEGRVLANGAPSEVLEPTRLRHAYDHDIEILTHPRTGALLVVPAAHLEPDLPGGVRL